MIRKKFVSKDSLYNENIKKSRLYGVYIPRDIDDALKKLTELTSDEARENLKTTDEQTVAHKLFFGLGRWMTYNWNFEEGSRFSHYLRQKGLIYTDDMTTCMLILFHRHVTGKPLETDALINQLIKERQKKIEEEQKNSKIIEVITKPSDHKD
ncbi:MAG: putative GTP cyclohydrolase II [Bacteroidetes bacterium OLB9]|nr:MAG: putative GTP cyclohydrolase II [Bacteroidetes bacterium OLB9]